MDWNVRPEVNLPVFITCVTARLVFSVTSALFFRPRSPMPSTLRIWLGASPLVYVAEAYLVFAAGVGMASALVALAFYLGALCLFFWAVRAHGAERPPPIFACEPPETLVSCGPYRHIRHPFYAAYLLAFVGSVAATGSAIVVAIAAVNLGVYVLAARAEERKFLEITLADEYAAYRARTGMFIPRLWR